MITGMPRTSPGGDRVRGAVGRGPVMLQRTARHGGELLRALTSRPTRWCFRRLRPSSSGVLGERLPVLPVVRPQVIPESGVPRWRLGALA